MLIPFASSPTEGCREAIRRLRLPRLEQLLGRWTEGAPDAGEAQSLSPPHERALALARGWPVADGLVPLAAWDAHQAGLPHGAGGWARVSPCHWRVGTDHVAMADPGELQLDETGSRAVLAIAAPYFEQDGLTLHYHGPLLWLAQGALFEDLPTASLDRVIGREIDPWMPRSEAARPLRRLQQEMQMLLYTAPWNDERQARGHLPVNSMWVSGTGRLPAATIASNEPQVNTALRGAALRDDWAGWSAAWEQLDAEFADAALARITLCGERGARTWSAAGTRSLAQRLGALWRRPALTDILESL
ncbi:phosphoglycerate mutase [Caenimonas sedimenti]|uniref:phosphoglycerate mutase n=1 Tax=Caenimonas sedimenti TaxID=2596921 RepID=UPI0021074DE8|nr:phosphoglycerate mutase [Caenimonas sedimenti]